MLHVSPDVWNRLREMGRSPNDRRWPRSPELRMMMGIPVVVEPGWPHGMWQLWDGGRLVRWGLTMGKTSVTGEGEVPHFAPGRAPVPQEE